MNMLEHSEVLKETFDGIFFGEVVDRRDDKEYDRVKVRVFGVFDDPIEVAHIPWAYPARVNGELPSLGDIVTVFFREGDLYQPIYL